MRQIRGSTLWECTGCRGRVELAHGQRPSSMFVTGGVNARERVVFVGNDIVHRCAYGMPGNDDRAA